MRRILGTAGVILLSLSNLSAQVYYTSGTQTKNPNFDTVINNPGTQPSVSVEGKCYWDSTAHGLKCYDGSAWALASGTGTVTSVGLSLPAIFTVTNSPVTTTGTLTGTLATQLQNLVFASPNGSTGAPTFRSLVSGDIPSLSYCALAGCTMVGNLIFTDNTYDIGAAGATRPRNFYLAGILTAGGKAVFGTTAISTTADNITINSSNAPGISFVHSSSDAYQLATNYDASNDCVFRNSTRSETVFHCVGGSTAANRMFVSNIKFGLTAGLYVGSKLLVSNTAPTISSGFGTGASITNNNGTHSFTIGVGTGGSQAGVVGLPTASTGWICFASDVTTNASYIVSQTASSTTTATLQSYSRTTGLATNWTDSDVLQVSCAAY